MAKEKTRLSGGIDTIITGIVGFAVSALLLVALLPMLTEALVDLAAGYPTLATIIDNLPMLIVLGFVVGVIFWVVGYIRKQTI